MTVRVEFDAGYKQVEEYFLHLERGDYLENVIAFAREWGDEIRENIRKHILARDLDWQQLAKTTVNRKGHDAPYIDTGFYLQNIKVAVEKPNRFDVFMSVYPEGKHPKNNVDLQDVAEMLEMGDGRGHYPARPLWRPVKNEMWNYSAIRNLDPFQLLGGV